MYACMYVCMYVCTNVYMHVCVYVCTVYMYNVCTCMSFQMLHVYIFNSPAIIVVNTLWLCYTNMVLSVVIETYKVFTEEASYNAFHFL